MIFILLLNFVDFNRNVKEPKSKSQSLQFCFLLLVLFLFLIKQVLLAFLCKWRCHK